MRTRAIPERFCGGDSLGRGAISSACSFTFSVCTFIDDCFIARLLQSLTVKEFGTIGQHLAKLLARVGCLCFFFLTHRVVFVCLLVFGLIGRDSESCEMDLD